MAGRIQGITIEIDGNTTKLTKSLSDVNNTLRKTSTDLKDVNKLLKLNPGNIALVKQKQDLLKTSIDATKQKLEQEKKALAQLQEADESPEVKRQMEALERQIVEDTNKLNAMEKELAEIKPGHLDPLNAKLKAVGEKAQVVGQKMQAVGQKMKDVGSSMTQTVTAPIVAGFTIAAKVASDYSESLNKIDVAFGKNAQSVKDFTETTTEQFGISKAAAAEMASGFGALAKGIGLSEDKAATMSTTLTGLSGDLASYFNVGQDEAAKALESIFTGESEALKKFGIVMTDTNLEKFAEEHGKVWKEMSQEERTMLRYQFVLEKTKDAQGDYARTSDSTANSIKTAQAALSDLALVFGEMVLPVITPIIQKLTEFIQKITTLPAPVQKVIAVIALVAAAIGPVLVIIGTLISAVGTIVSAFGAASAAIGGGGVALTALTGPIGIAIAVIAGLIAAGVLLYKNWDKIKAGVQWLAAEISAKFKQIKAYIITTWTSVKTYTQQAWNNIKAGVVQRVTSLIAGVKQKITDLKTNIAGAWDAIKTKATTAWEGIKTAVVDKAKSIVKGVKEQFEKIKDGIKEKLESAKKTAKEIIDKIKGFFNFSWKIPKPKVPKFTLKVNYKTLGGIKIPIPSITPHYAKAYHQPYLFSQPTMAGGAVFGDRNGDEMVYGRENLMRDISKAAGVDSNKIYEAVKAGASEANITMYVGERELGRVLRDMGVVFA